MGSHESEPAAAVLVALRRIVRFLRLADRQAEAAVGLSAAQLFVLQSLAQQPARSVAELAQRTLTDQSSVSTVVARLVERKLITRRAAADDRRRAELRATAAGERLVDRAPRVPQVRIAEIVRAMPAQQRTEFVRSLESFITAIGANEVAPRMLFEDEPAGVRRSRSRVRA
jgi:DNA-binding MarR family transcriptional regulator